MNEISVEDLSPSDAQHLLGMYLSQSDKAYAELGYRSWGDAYQKIGSLLGLPPANIKFDRDHFDKYSPSSRKGWDKPNLSAPLQEIVDAIGGINELDGRSSAQLLDLAKKIIQRDWSEVRSNQLDNRLEAQLIKGFQIDGFTPLVEPMDTTWGIRNRPGRTFRLSNSDLIIAFDEILENWGEWKTRRLNENSVNPDATLTDFARSCFSEGAHQVLANDQRRGFLHLISAITYISSRGGIFDQSASNTVLKRKDYERALERLNGIETEAVEGFSKILNAPQLASIDSPETESGTAHPASIGENKIYYGAPGTGKSYAVNGSVGKVNVVRTIFHPDTQNSDFFGCLKPEMAGDKVTYQFAPGPLSRALCAAMRDKKHHHYLVIEELNRAPAAAVFGELFQLLDRDDDGLGEYPVDFPNPESASWFARQGVASQKLIMPANLSIIATMNSADQGVYPLDTAFRRRWEQEYLPLYEGDGPQGEVCTHGAKGEEIRLGWKTFVKELNDWLIKLDLAEDRLLGLWFVKERELGKYVPAKILLYLWDDLLRHEGRGHMFASQIKTYGALNQAVKAGKPIFSEGFLIALKAKLPTAAIDPVSAPEEAENAEGQ